jgi:hypothetical protein
LFFRRLSRARSQPSAGTLADISPETRPRDDWSPFENSALSAGGGFHRRSFRVRLHAPKRNVIEAARHADRTAPPKGTAIADEHFDEHLALQDVIWEEIMRHPSAISIAIVAAVLISATAAAPADEAKYPDWKGQWNRIGGGGQFDPTKPPGRGQEPPLTPEYQAIWDAHLKEQAAGGQSYNTRVRCMPGGMPRMMMAYEPMEIIITPEITYVRMTFDNEFRRIYTDGRDWPKETEPSYAGYSIGKWANENGDGRYNMLEVETRDLKGPRIFDPSGIPLHEDNQTVVKERIALDKSDQNILRDEITTIDHALTRPWVITRSYKRERKPNWIEEVCAESNQYVIIGGQTYLVSLDGYLMPIERNQPPPDLKFFKPSQK